MIQLSSKPISTCYLFSCPCCGKKPSISSESTLCECGYPYPLTYVIPYDFPWSFEEPFITEFRKHRALRLLGKFVGKDPDRLVELDHVEYLYLSRYPKFDFNWLKGFRALRMLELDYMQFKTLDGIEHLPLTLLGITELRQLEE